jgi:pantoate--beta-alanine ligase
MGNLHRGHIELINIAKPRAACTVVSIFVNRLQFGPKEDLSRDPRDLGGDLAKCGSAHASVVYAPEPEGVYPAGYQTYVNVEQVSQGLCGERRPGHFRGVATVVTKLLALFRPDVALFGEKDYQQLKVIEALARDLDLGVDIVGRPTVREADGLAMSSRNAYLSAEERQRALSLSKGLFAMQAAVAGGARSCSELVSLGTKPLSDAQVRLDYLEVRDASTLEPLTTLTAGRPARALVAGFLGTTRLIDNVALVVT